MMASKLDVHNRICIPNSKKPPRRQMKTNRVHIEDHCEKLYSTIARRFLPFPPTNRSTLQNDRTIGQQWHWQAKTSLRVGTPNGPGPHDPHG